MAFWNWSKTASNNATADSSINWSEGLSPSSVNDSARAMMARLAEERDDFSGLLATTGTSTAYLVTTNQTLNVPTPTDGQMISVTVNVTNGIAPTLAADGGTAFPIQSSPGVAVGAGTLVSGSPYTLKFSTSNSAWMLRNFYGSPFVVPLGGITIFSGTTSPNSNFVFANGQAISRTTYATYFALVGTTYGVGNGTTTFNVPDLRERTLAFQGTMGGVASPSRITTAGSGIDGTTLGAVGGAQNVTIAQGNLPAVTLNTSIASGQGSHNHTAGGASTFFVQAASQNRSTNVVGGTGDVGSGTMDAATLPAMTGTTPLGGSGTATVTMPPTIMLTALVRIF